MFDAIRLLLLGVDFFGTTKTHPRLLHVMQQEPFILGNSLRHRVAAIPHMRHGRPIEARQFNLAFRASHPKQCRWLALFDSIRSMPDYVRKEMLLQRCTSAASLPPKLHCGLATAKEVVDETEQATHLTERESGGYVLEYFCRSTVL